MTNKTRITTACGRREPWRTIRLAALVLSFLAPRAAPLAQLGSFNPPAGPHGTYAITNARIVPVSGPEIARGTVVIGPDGTIKAVGVNVTIPGDAKIIDASGLTVWPGMMDAGTQLGLREISQGAASTVDNAEIGSLNPNAHAYWAIDPNSAHVGVTRVVGITHVVSSPSGGLISGESTIINLAGYTVSEMALVKDAALVINLPRAETSGRRRAAPQGAPVDASQQRRAQMDSIRNIIRDAAAYGTAIDAYAKEHSLPRPKHDVILASLVPAVRGQMPVIFTADRASEIRDAVEFARELHLVPVIMGGRDAWQIASYLKENNVPVVLTDVRSLPAREDDPYDVNFSAPAKLAQAGVLFAIASGDGGPEVRDLPYVAGMAAAFGLSKTDALKSVTLWPAQIFGIADRLGSIDVGKMGNLVVTDGDLLEPRTHTRYLFIDGRPVSLENKQTELYETFKARR